MKPFTRFPSALFLLLGAIFSASVALAEPPAPPESGVVDSGQILPLPALKATERVLLEHQRLTLETIYVVTFAESPAEGVEKAALSLTDAWKAETPRPPNVVVIAVDAAKGQLAIAAGLGLDAITGGATDRTREVRRVFFDPEWKSGKKYRALVFAIVETLRTLESPLVTSGEAVEAYERAGFSGGWIPAAPAARTSTTWIWMVLAGAIFAFALYRTLAVEVHTIGEGWHRIPVSEVLTRRLRKSKAPPLLTGGGVSGKY
jgi:uncharacterized membrane protein YgcG